MPLSTSAGLAASTVGVSPYLREFYVKAMLKRLVPKYIFLKDGYDVTLPRGAGDRISWRRRNRVVIGATGTATTYQLVEGTTPDQLTRSTDRISAQVLQFGGWFPTTDKGEIISFDNLMAADMDDLTDFQSEVDNLYVRDIIMAGTNVLRPNGRTSRGTVTSTDVLDDATLKKAVAFLRNKNVPTFPDGLYHAFMPSLANYDLMGTDGYKNTGYYQLAKAIKDGEVDTLYGIKFIDTSLATVYTAAGASSANVYGTLVFGPGAYGVPRLDELGSTFINHPIGSSGAADPLNQRGSRGTKSALGAAILDDNKMVRIEHALAYEG
jgi:N4-gp56 family major capsid protein